MKFYKDKDWLYQKYWKEKLSQQNIANLCNVTKRTVRIWMRKFDIKIRNISEGRKEYHKRNPGIMQGQRKYGSPGKLNPMFGLRGEDHPAWKSGNKRSYNKIARRNWEEYWRQEVPKGYLIHHVDKDIKNNEITNLALITHRTHAINHEFYKHFGDKE